VNYPFNDSEVTLFYSLWNCRW